MNYGAMFVALVGLFLVYQVAGDLTFYTAAVFEHAAFRNSSYSRETVVRTNLHFYEKATRIAKSKGADIIVFPEYGIVPSGNRSELTLYAEAVPNPADVHVNPCTKSEAYAKTPIIYNLSCFARNYSTFVVGNMIEAQSCEGQPGCRDDGLFLFNTNLVFDRTGKLVLKYHKENLFLEDGIDAAREEQVPIFETDFGKFSTFICFDIQFKRMGEVSEAYKVDGMAYPTYWDEEPPLLTSLQVQESWSIAHNTTLLAANNNAFYESSVGSGIYNGISSTIGYTYNPDGLSKLLVARVPKRGHHLHSSEASLTVITADSEWPFTTDGADVKSRCSYLYLSPNDTETFRCYSENVDNYSFVPLSTPSGNLVACNNGMCCSLNYETLGLNDSYYLGVYNGTENSSNSRGWSEETCVLTICDPYEDQPCAVFPRRSRTKFRTIFLKANFTSQDIYPSIMGSGMRLIPHTDWGMERCIESKFDGCLKFSNNFGRAIIAFGMQGRAYSRDP